ncbi:hypothetical protein SGRA_1996 [Saprospira grandis str. Lewin]|uniref:Uncharacterized protein n=1 Tax=Saprospira grandis (strain Lewin) TaxID=984262 RepID=H6L289_SAPGL|nr:hypothetical protein SGRA_1996 [Saprospira grandis str. Lewin]
MRVKTLINLLLRSNTNCCLAVGFNLQAHIAGGKAAAKERSDWPSDAKGGGEAADQGRQAEGPSRPASPEA